jgi:hypothetical protein
MIKAFLVVAGLTVGWVAAAAAEPFAAGTQIAVDEGDLALPATAPSAVMPPEDGEVGVVDEDGAAFVGPEYAEEILFQQRVDEAVEKAVAARMKGLPRPMYFPATDVAPPKGLLLYSSKQSQSPFPFSFALEGFLQARWLELARGTTEWTDSIGITRPVRNENVFNLNRIYLQSQGFVGSERVLWNIALFGSTDAGLIVNFVPLGFVGFAITEDIRVGGGVTQVPGTREWLMSSRWPMGVDRSMANTFFRPSYSPGVLFMGSVLDKSLSFQAGVWNGIDGGFAGVFRQSTAMAWAGNM